MSGQAVTPPLDHKGDLSWAAFNHDGSRVVTASWDGTAQVWDAVSGKAIGPRFAHESSATWAEFSPDGRSGGHGWLGSPGPGVGSEHWQARFARASSCQPNSPGEF